MSKRRRHIIVFFMIVICTLISIKDIEAQGHAFISLDEHTEKENVYPAMYMIKDRDMTLTIDEVITNENAFIPADDIVQQFGFFETATWLRFELHNHSDQHNWLLEFAFPLINDIRIYTIENDEIVRLHVAGTDLPFAQRDIKHRHFVFDLNIDPDASKTFYIVAVGSGDLHPPIIVWNKDRFIEKTQREFILLGIFCGVIIVMILYNLFLFFSLRLKSYLYYVLVISFTLLGKLSINGLAFQYIWPNAPRWNVISTPFWVAIACIFILIFTRSFLNTDQYSPTFKKVMYALILCNTLIIVMLPINRFIAMYIMVIAAIATFITVLFVALVCLKRGAYQARFYLLGWFIFLTGVSMTILERAVILPFNVFTEYAGQAALSIEVVLLSFALADKINIMRHEKELAERKAQEIQAVALKNLEKADELKDEFLAVTSHELRTPLYGIIGIAQSLLDGAAGHVSDKMKNQLAMIIISGQRLTHIVNDILDFTNLKHDTMKLEMKPIDVNSIVDIVVAVSKPLAQQKNIELINAVDASLPAARADENRLQQILYNLVDNAIKHTEEGSITITAFAEVDQLTINVTDTGQGIDEDQLELIFEPFQQGSITLSRQTSGVGIGLNITKKLVHLHGGQLNVASKLGKGTTFSVVLPLHHEASKPIEAIQTLEHMLHEQPQLYHFPQQVDDDKPRILVADDEIINLQVLVNQLSLNGYKVWTTSRGEDVLRMVDEHDIDLLILDIMMPGMSGYEIGNSLRRSYSLIQLPILMLTAKNQLQDKLIAFEAGANDYLVKPCDKEELLSRVETLVRMKKLNQELIQMNLLLEDKIAERTQELSVANEHLQAVSQSRRELLANIAHELGTPITLFRNYIQSLQKGLISPNDKHFAKLVSDKMNVLNRLIDDLFDLSKLESGKISLILETQRVDEWLEDIYAKAELMVQRENRQFEHSTIPSSFKDITCLVDLERGDQLFSNLLSNAIKNTPNKNGKIMMSAHFEEPDRLIIEIHDNGYGIHPDDLPYIFDRFYKASPSNQSYSGTGLGLAIVKQIVHSHHGHIRVESIEHKGTSFYITLPAKRQV